MIIKQICARLLGKIKLKFFRAALAKNLFEIDNLNIQNIDVDDEKSMKFLNMIDCPGAGNNRMDGPRICAATGGSYFDKEGWTIMLGSNNIKVCKF